MLTSYKKFQKTKLLLAASHRLHLGRDFNEIDITAIADEVGAYKHAVISDRTS